MSEKRTRLTNGDKMAILEAIRIPGYKKEDIMKQYNIGKSAFYSIIQQKDKLYQDMFPAKGFRLLLSSASKIFRFSPKSQIFFYESPIFFCPL